MKITHEGKELELTADDMHYGAMAHKEFKEGKNPPSWVQNEDIWSKAKTAALKTYDLSDDEFWPSVTTIYRSMHGTIGGNKETKAQDEGGDAGLEAKPAAVPLHDESKEKCPDDGTPLDANDRCPKCGKVFHDNDADDVKAKAAADAAALKAAEDAGATAEIDAGDDAYGQAAKHAASATRTALADTEAGTDADKCAVSHEVAEQAHMNAATLTNRQGKIKFHTNQAAYHRGMKKVYKDGARDVASAKEAKVASQEDTALHCASQSANQLRSLLPTAEGVLMYMPGGDHTITPSQGGKPVTVTVRVDEPAAERLEQQRAKLAASGKKPFFSILHESDVAAFWPTKFFWDRRIDATGSFVEGIWAEGEWSKSGRDAVEGKDFRTFSPTFFVDAIRNDPSNPCQVVCNENARPNMGALENDPAFQSISPLWARNAGGDSLRRIIRACHEIIRDSDPDIASVQAAVKSAHNIQVTEMQVAEALL